MSFDEVARHSHMIRQRSRITRFPTIARAILTVAGAVFASTALSAGADEQVPSPSDEGLVPISAVQRVVTSDSTVPPAVPPAARATPASAQAAEPKTGETPAEAERDSAKLRPVEPVAEPLPSVALGAEAARRYRRDGIVSYGDVMVLPKLDAASLSDLGISFGPRPPLSGHKHQLDTLERDAAETAEDDAMRSRSPTPLAPVSIIQVRPSPLRAVLDDQIVAGGRIPLEGLAQRYTFDEPMLRSCRATDVENSTASDLMALGFYHEAEQLLVFAYLEALGRNGIHHLHTQRVIQSLVTLYELWGKEKAANVYRGWLEK